MIRSQASSPSRGGGNRRRRILQLEPLEDRMLLYAFNGGEWVVPDRITFSFVPDGTLVGGVPSRLNQMLAQRGFSTAQWQNQFRRAAAIWQNASDINLVEVSDDGTRFAAPGNQQGDTRFGDIRIAGIALDSGTVGISFLPPPLNGGTLAGDIVMNSSVLWNINTDFDILTVALHEFGHSLGLDHSTAANAGNAALAKSSAMYAAYTGVKQSLSTDDIAGIQGVYGARQHDVFDQAMNNGAYTTATPITSMIHNRQIRLDGLDITGADTDIYYVVAPAGTTSTVTFTMQSTDLSVLSPKLQIHRSNYASIGLISSVAYGATISVTVTGVSAGDGFYIRAMSAGAAGGLTGAYGLLVDFSGSGVEPIEPASAVVIGDETVGGSTMGAQVVVPSINKGELLRIGTLAGHGDVMPSTGTPVVTPGPQYLPYAISAYPVVTTWVDASLASTQSNDLTAPRKSSTSTAAIDLALGSLTN